MLLISFLQIVKKIFSFIKKKIKLNNLNNIEINFMPKFTAKLAGIQFEKFIYISKYLKIEKIENFFLTFMYYIFLKNNIASLYI